MKFTNAEEVFEYLKSLHQWEITFTPFLLDGKMIVSLVFLSDTSAIAATSELYSHPRWPENTIIVDSPHQYGRQLIIPLPVTNRLLRQSFSQQELDTFAACIDVCENHPNVPFIGRNFINLISKVADILNFEEWSESWRDN